MRGARIEFRGVSRHYGHVVALHETDLTIEPGEFFALLGPSGSGKSTLLGAVTGFTPPSSGQVLINGKNVTDVPPYRRNIGMVFQNYALFPFMTVFQNVAFPLQTRKMPKAEIKQRVERSLAMVRLSDMAGRLPRQLSGGQQQRIALARASVYDPPVLLMDEPLGALDKNLREELQDEIRQFHRDVGATIIYVTHDQAEAAALADRVAILRAGRLEQIGTPRGLYENPRNGFVAGFLGEANRFAVDRITDEPGGVRLATREGLTLAAARGTAGEAIVCVRPERIAIGEAADGHANSFQGTVIDAVFSAGSVRYRVDVAGCTLLVRAGSDRTRNAFDAGAPVHVGWDRDDALVLPA
ncbi:MAG: ABC transporter ATP-binding protein [Proteobacteria bacterium]|nr:ABC transporter ATP-binding protein [Pseudomonadota bacterium]